MKVFCPRCGSENENECKFCEKCGQSLSEIRNILMENNKDDFIRKSENVTQVEDITQVKVAQANVASNERDDYQEEKKVIPSDKNDDDFEEENTRSGERKKNVIIIFLIIIACIAVFSGAYLYFYNKYSTTSESMIENKDKSNNQYESRTYFNSCGLFYIYTIH